MRDAPVDLRLLAGAGAPARDFKAGEVIFREGDPAHELFIIQSGEIEIRLGNRVLETPPIRHFRRNGLDRFITPQGNGRRRHRYEARFREREAISVSRQLTPYFALNVMRIMWRAACARRTGFSIGRPPRFPLTDTARERKRIARCPSP